MFHKREVHLLTVALQLRAAGKLSKASANILSRAFTKIGVDSPRFIKHTARS